MFCEVYKKNLLCFNSVKKIYLQAGFILMNQPYSFEFNTINIGNMYLQKVHN